MPTFRTGFTATLVALGLIAAALGAPQATAAASTPSATFESWSPYSAGGAAITISVDHGVKHSGEVSLRLTNATSRAGGMFGGIMQAVPVVPSTTYQFSAWVWADGSPSSIANSFLMNASWNPQIAIPGGNFEWQKLSWEYVTAPAETSITLTLLSQDRGTLWLDDLSMVRQGTTANLIANAGFESASDVIRIVTTDLLLAQGPTAAVSIESSNGSVAWSVTSSAGAPVSSGIAATAAGSASIPLSNLPAGYYSLRMIAGSTVRTTNLAIVSGATPKGSPFGVTLHPNLHGDLNQASLMTDLGLGQARVSLRWETIETAPGVYTWDPNVDAEVARLGALGIQPIGILAYYNENYDGGRTPSSPAGVQGFANFARAAAAHYGTAMSYEVYNEWNASTTTSACGRTPECYLQLLVPTAKAIRSVAPGATVVGPALGGLTSHWLTTDESFGWLARFFELGGLDQVDAISIHNYGFPSAPEGHNSSVISRVRTLMSAHAGGAQMPLWLTETGWSSIGTASGGVDETQQADYLVRDAVMSIAAGAERYYVYDLLDDWPDPSNAAARFGLFRNPTLESGTLTPKPAALALAAMTRELAGFRFVGTESVVSGVYCYLFVNAAGVAKRVLWATGALSVTAVTNSAATITTPSGTVSAPVLAVGTVTVALGSSPVYLSGSGAISFASRWQGVVKVQRVELVGPPSASQAATAVEQKGVRPVTHAVLRGYRVHERTS